jgi:hypothetical protein
MAAPDSEGGRNQEMEQGRLFRYIPSCSATGCDHPAIYKIATLWSDGTSHELKNYGLVCEAHRHSQLTLARNHHQALRLSDGESVGAVELYVLRTGCRDIELTRLGDAE